jgi:hypothetical protein
MKRSQLVRSLVVLAVAAGSSLAVVGVTSTASAQSSTAQASASLPGGIDVKQLPAGALELTAAVKTAKVGETITVRGRVAMSQDAFVKNRAMFTIVDEAADKGCCPSNADKLPETSCNIPAESKATIQIVDERGRTLRSELSGVGGLKPGAEVFVIGKVQAANGKGALVINATGLHVPKDGIPNGLFLGEAPSGAQDLSEARKKGNLKPGQTVTLRGVVGGGKDPFVAGRAVFTLMGTALKPCTANPDDHCKTPWDYCCETKADIAANSATVRVADSKGNPLRTDLKGRASVKELSEVIVTGTVASAESDGVVINASSLHVVRP